jgi:membrane protease YdiL (CAAX protease family)
MISNYTYKPFGYFAATFLATYVLWFIGAYISFANTTGLHMVFMLLGLLAPFLISLFMIFSSRNVDLKKDFINRLINLRLIQLKMLPIFLLLMPLSALTSIALSLLCGESISQFKFTGDFSFSAGFVPVLLLLALAATLEELGWRGYAFDSLQSRYTYFKASLIFSILWSLWHLPAIFVKNSYQYEIVNQSIWFGLNFFVGIIPMGLIISWICIKNNKSIPAAIIFHFIINMTQEMFAMTQFTKCIQTLVLIAIATVIVVIDKELFFSSQPLITKN